MIKVSVIIPVYNVEKYLPACLDSVLSQTLREIEVICIDDASPDHSGEILDEYAALDQRVQVLHLQENFMQGYGRNRGIEMAKGKYIYFLDSDDMITATALEELYNLAEQDALDGIFFDSQVMYESEEMKRHGSSYICMRKGNYPDAVLPGDMRLYNSVIGQKPKCYCVVCGAPIYSNSNRAKYCPTCNKSHQRMMDAAKHRRQYKERKKQTAEGII